MGIVGPFSPPGLNLPHTKNSLGASHKDWLLHVITGWEARMRCCDMQMQTLQTPMAVLIIWHGISSSLTTQLQRSLSLLVLDILFYLAYIEDF